MTRKLFKSALGAALVVACLIAVPARAAGPSANLFPAKSPLRYHTLRYNFSTTSSITAGVLGALPPGGCVIKDIVVTQSTAGSGGTSWAADVKRNEISVASTNGAFTQAAADGKVTNVLASPMGRAALVLAARIDDPDEPLTAVAQSVKQLRDALAAVLTATETAPADPNDEFTRKRIARERGA